MTKGKFIVFEGIDGCGKTTQITLLKEHLEAQGRKVHLTEEPTVSMSGGILRDALSGISKRTPCEMAALFALDRIFHNVNPINGIEKMLNDGYDVICDRYYYSSLAYQGSETDFGWVKDLNLECPEIRKPDLCIFLDLTPAESLERINKGRTVTEIYETEEKLEKFRSGFFEVFEMLKDSDNVAVVSAFGSIDEVAERVKKAYESAGLN